MRRLGKVIVPGLALLAMAACADAGGQQQRAIDADLDASRTQRGDALYPDTTMPHREHGTGGM